MIDDECGAIGGLRIGRGNRSTRRKPVPVPHKAVLKMETERLHAASHPRNNYRLGNLKFSLEVLFIKQLVALFLLKCLRSCVLKLHNEKLHNLYFSPSIIRMIKSRRMRWAGNVARMGEKRNSYRILVGKPEGHIKT
jgi:hypothetical protein